eukprot:s2890_g2.t1
MYWVKWICEQLAARAITPTGAFEVEMAKPRSCMEIYLQLKANADPLNQPKVCSSLTPANTAGVLTWAASVELRSVKIAPKGRRGPSGIGLVAAMTPLGVGGYGVSIWTSMQGISSVRQAISCCDFVAN